MKAQVSVHKDQDPQRFKASDHAELSMVLHEKELKIELMKMEIEKVIV